MELKTNLPIQIIPNFIPTTKNTIVLQVYVIEVGKKISIVNGMAYDDNGKVINPFVAGVYISKIPSSDKAWQDLTDTIEKLNVDRKNKNLPTFDIDSPAVVKLTLNNNLSAVISQIEELKQNSKKRQSDDSEQQYEEPTEDEKPERPANRMEDFYPYSTDRKDSDGNTIEQVDICNFNVVFKCILRVGDVLRTRCNINYKESATDENKVIEDIETDKITFHDRQLFTQFFAKHSHQLWYNKRMTNELLTEINKDETLQKPTVVDKTQDFGFNKSFTSFLTPEWDYELQVNNEGIFEKDHKGLFVLRDHLLEYCTKHNIDINHPDEEHLPKIEGSVKILNEKIKDSIKLGFKSNVNVKNVLIHIRDTLMKLSPTVDRTISIVFLSPLSSILQELDLSYQMYLQGKSGYGKSQMAILYMNFFASVDNKDQLVNILRDKPNAVEEIGFYSKDSLFVLDNFKESAIDKKEFPKMIALLQSIADKQGTRRMTKSDFGSFRVRGTTLVTGEEMLQDASTIRKYDIVNIKDSDKINIDVLKECHIWKNNYSGIMGDYIQWLMKLYGNGIVSEIERRKIKHQMTFTNPIFILNMMGYELFLEYMLSHGIIDKQEAVSMYKSHFDILKKEEIEKEEKVESKMSYQTFFNAIQSGLTSRKFTLLNDPEYGDKGKGGYVIGQTNREATEVTFYTETYYLLQSINHSLPDDIDSVWDQIKNTPFIEKKIVHRCDKQQKARLITFKREFIIPHTNITSIASMKDIADEIIGLIEYTHKINQPPSSIQYNELVNNTLKLLPSNKKSEKEKFLRDTKVLIDMAFRAKFGADWVSPI